MGSNGTGMDALPSPGALSTCCYTLTLTDKCENFKRKVTRDIDSIDDQNTMHCVI